MDGARIGFGLDFKPLISAIIPARNEEASIARAVESVAAQPEIGEVIVVNDQSSDNTAQILRSLAGRITKLRVFETGELPAGWVGKTNAVALGAAHASGEWLLFTDADTFHLHGAAAHALADAERHKAVLVSYSPEQETHSFWERTLIPFVFWRLAARFSFERVNDPALPDAAANGQYLFVRRDAYDAVGGHAAVAGEVLEDVAFARLVKRSARRIYFAAPRGVVRTRMYRDFGAMWEGWTKNLYPLMGGTPGSLLRELAAVLPWAVALSVAAVYFAGMTSLGALLVAAICGLALSYAIYGIVLRRNLLPVASIQYYTAGVGLYSAALIASWWKNFRGAVRWKGRTYRVRQRPACEEHGGQGVP